MTEETWLPVEGPFTREEALLREIFGETGPNLVKPEGAPLTADETTDFIEYALRDDSFSALGRTEAIHGHVPRTMAS